LRPPKIINISSYEVNKQFKKFKKQERERERERELRSTLCLDIKNHFAKKSKKKEKRKIYHFLFVKSNKMLRKE